MSTTTQNPPATIDEYTRQIVETDPKAALEIALAMTEKVRLEAEKAKVEARGNAEVKMGPDGCQASNLGGIYRLGQMYASSTLVPDIYRNKPSDCAIVVQLAQRWGVDPFMAFQHVYMVHGKPGIDGQLAIALLNKSGKIVGTVQYRFDGEGDDYGCTASVTDATTKNTVYGPKVDWHMVKKEGWNKPKGNDGFPSKWIALYDLMFPYRAATYLIRTRYPEVLMGMQTTEELRDAGPESPPADAQGPPATLDELTDRMEETAEQQPEPAGNGETAEQPTEPEPEPEETPQSDPEAEDTPLFGEYTITIIDATMLGSTPGGCNEIEKNLRASFEAGDLTLKEHSTLLSRLEAKREKIRGGRGAGSSKSAGAAGGAK